MASKDWSPVLRLNAHGVARSLGDLEAEIMEIIWRTDAGLTIRDVSERIGRPLSFNTVMTVMNILMKKGLLARTGSRRSYVYRAALGREEFVTHLAQQVFRGLLEDFGDLAAAGFIEASDVIDEVQLNSLLERMRESARDKTSGRERSDAGTE